MRHSLPIRPVPFLALLLGLVTPSLSRAQDPWDPMRIYATRPDLDSLAHRLELAAESPAYSAILRAEAAAEAKDLRARLAEGDFQIGDRVSLRVEREQVLSDSFTVDEGPSLRLPTVGRISLAGVLRSELEGHLTQELSKYIRDPVVQAGTAVRVSILGAVGRPGFYVFSSQLLVTDVLARAGQIVGSADIGKIRIERAGRVIWDNEALAPEIITGRTLDELGIRAGDRIIVGNRTRIWSTLSGSYSYLYLIIGLPGAIIGFIALFT